MRGFLKSKEYQNKNIIINLDKKMNAQIFNLPLEESSKIVESLKSFLCSNGYSVQEFLKHDGLILQIRRGGGFKAVLGLSTALNVNIEQNERYFTISFSNGKWVDKAAVAGISMFVLWPLLITSAVGAYKQSELPNQIIQYVNSEVNRYFRKIKGL